MPLSFDVKTIALLRVGTALRVKVQSMGAKEAGLSISSKGFLGCARQAVGAWQNVSCSGENCARSIPASAACRRSYTAALLTPPMLCEECDISAKGLQLRFERQMPDDPRHDSSTYAGLRLMGILLHFAIRFAFPANAPLLQGNAIARLQGSFLLKEAAQFSHKTLILKHHAHFGI